MNRIVILFAAILLIAAGAGCVNTQLVRENEQLKARLGNLERDQARLRESLLAPPAQPPTPAAAPAAPPAAVVAVPPPPPIAPAFARGDTVGPGVGYLNRDPLDGRPCGGMCMELRNRSPYYMLILNDSREMTVFAGYQAVILPVNSALLAGGRVPRTASLVPPNEIVKWAMDSVGNHQIRVVFYTAIPGQSFLQPVGIWEMREDFPYQAFGQSYAWGRYQEVYSPSRKIDTY